MVEISLTNKKPNIKNLLEYGFQTLNDEYIFYADLADGQLKLTAKVTSEEKLYAEITDSASGDEYVLYRVAGAVGSFVGQVKAEYETAIENILKHCFENDVFKGEQIKQAVAYIQKTYSDELEFLWQRSPNNAIVRRKDNSKWYAAFLVVNGKKLGLDKDIPIEILDLRTDPDEASRIVDNKTYFPGYHMNKKHWITICLDGRLGINEIYQRIDESFLLAKTTKRKGTREGTATHDNHQQQN